MTADRSEGAGRTRRYTVPFFFLYFFYYSAYCIFSSYTVLFLTELSYSAMICGIITSVTFVSNLLMEPVGGYITDTFLTTRRYLLFCIGILSALCLFCTRQMRVPYLMLPAMVLASGLAYPFSQLMDAWVNISRELDSRLVYSRIRAGGSIGFAIMSMAAGAYFKQNGWNGYFLVQLFLFLLMVPFLLCLPEPKLGNRRQKEKNVQEHSLSMPEALRGLLGNKSYLFCLTVTILYWFSHRPVGSYLSLIISERGGDAAVYGNVCGIGGVVESVSLFLLAAFLRRKKTPPMQCMAAALVTNLLRPLCLWLGNGIWPFYAGQMLQSVSFAFFLTSSVECFAKVSDERIRSLGISLGLTVSSVAGTVLANLLGGGLCDCFGTRALIRLSLTAAMSTLFLFVFMKKRANFRCKIK